MKGDALAAVMERADRGLVPIALTIEVTHRCNLGCVHCYAECGGERASVFGPKSSDMASIEGASATGPGGRRELSTRQWVGLLSQAAAAGSLYLTVTGGEPLLRTDLMALLTAARDLDYAVRLLTNATLIDAAMAARLAALPLIGAEVSIHGASAKVHDRITGHDGSHERMLSGIRHLLDHGVPVTGKMPVHELNADEVPAAFALADELGIVLRADPMITPTNTGDSGPTELRLGPAAYRALLEQLLERGATAVPVQRSLDEAPCTAGRTQAAIGPTGLLYPCVGFPEPAGDLLVDTIADVWRESPVLARLRSLSLGDLERCADCELAGYCRRCPGVAFLEAGSECAEVPFACMMAGECRDAHLRG